MSEHEQLTRAVVEAVQRRLGTQDSDMARVVAEEVGLALGAQHGSNLAKAAGKTPHRSAPDRVVITATGENRSGIVARLTSIIDEFNGDIHDINQTLVDRYFTMLIVVDISDATSDGARFSQLRQRLREAAQDMGIHVVALHDDILSTMHSV